MRKVFLTVASLILSCVSVLAGSHGSTVSTIMGTNVSTDLRDTDPENPFLNILKANLGWQFTNGNSCAPINGNGIPQMQLDANGFPTSMVLTGTSGCSATNFYLSTLFPSGNLADGSPFFPQGTYVLLWSGGGTVSASVNSSNCVFVENGGTGRDIYTCNPNQGNSSIRATITATPVTNLQMVYSPGSTGASGGNVVGRNELLLKNGEYFNPDFVAKVRRFSGLRFVDWIDIIHNQEANWADRTTPGWYTWTYQADSNVTTQTGVPFEVVIALCNEINAQCHITVPVQFTNAAVTSLAQLAHSTLKTTALVEYGNEFWNNVFSGPNESFLNTQQALTGDGSIINYGITRSTQVNDIFTTAYGADAATKLVRLLGGQNGFLGRNQFIMTYTNAGQFTGVSATHADKLSVAPYWDFVGGGYPIAWSADTDPYAKFFLQTNNGNLIPGGQWQTQCTSCISIASPAVVSWTGSNLGANAAVQFSTSVSLPGGITAGTIYFVISTGLTANSFEFSTTQGGAAVNTSGSQTGTQSVIAGCTTGGTSTAYTVSSNLANCAANGSFASQPPNGTMVVVNLNQASGANPTLAVDGGTAFAIKDPDGGALSSLATGMYVLCLTSATQAGAVSPAQWREVTPNTPSDPITVTAYYYGQNYTNAQANTPVLGLEAYEGGQNFVAGNDATRQAWFAGAQRDPRMGSSYANWLSQIKTQGHSSLVMHFQDVRGNSTSGDWGLLEGINQSPLSPKFNTVSTFN